MGKDSYQSEYELFSGLWELTLRCNMNCMHCGSVAGSARHLELTLDECYRVADEFVELGGKELTFIGGEIFLYKGWEKVSRRLADQGVAVNTMSNGYRIGEKQIGQIEYAQLSNVGISVDGMKENHTKIRGKEDAFSQIMNTFNLLNQADIRIGVVTCLMEFNYPDLEDMYELFVDNNVQLWQLQLANPMGNLADKRELIINPKKIPQITEFVREKNMEKTMLVIAADSIGYFDDNEMYIRGRSAPICYWQGCQAGVSSLFIDSVGNIKGCGAMYDEAFIEGNVREKSLADIWHDSENFSYNRKFNVELLSGKCSGCDVGDTCRGGCRASNFFTTKSLYESYFCRHKNEVISPVI